MQTWWIVWSPNVVIDLICFSKPHSLSKSSWSSPPPYKYFDPRINLFSFSVHNLLVVSASIGSHTHSILYFFTFASGSLLTFFCSLIFLFIHVFQLFHSREKKISGGSRVHSNEWDWYFSRFCYMSFLDLWIVMLPSVLHLKGSNNFRKFTFLTLYAVPLLWTILKHSRVIWTEVFRDNRDYVDTPGH